MTTEITNRAEAALRLAFIADALAMPVHWYYNPQDILKAFPGGVRKMEAAPAYHPSSIMALHSTSKGGRGAQAESGPTREIVGEVILKGKRRYWGKPNQHYHQQMQAGENTLNAHCARVLMRVLNDHEGHYHKNLFLEAYINFMTADPPLHPDTYAESCHRGFFANLEHGLPPDKCGAVTHDTPSIGGLVTIAPLVLAERLRGNPLGEVQKICRQHLFLTHPDEDLAHICRVYVELLDALLFRKEAESAEAMLARAARNSLGLDLPALAAKSYSDLKVVGGIYSPACYISGSWPSVLYLAYKYCADPRQALIANTNLGGDNVHRGAVLGAILGLATGNRLEGLFDQLVERDTTQAEISGLVLKPDNLKLRA